MSYIKVTAESAKKLGFQSVPALTRRLRAKELPGSKVGRFWYVSKAEIDEAIKKKSNMEAVSNG